MTIIRIACVVFDVKKVIQKRTNYSSLEGATLHLLQNATSDLPCGQSCSAVRNSHSMQFYISQYKKNQSSYPPLHCIVKIFSAPLSCAAEMRDLPAAFSLAEPMKYPGFQMPRGHTGTPWQPEEDRNH